MKELEYMAIISEEIVHIIKCTPVDVKIQYVQECFKFPIQKGNETYFLFSRTHILIKRQIN